MLEVIFKFYYILPRISRQRESQKQSSHTSLAAVQSFESLGWLVMVRHRTTYYMLLLDYSKSRANHLYSTQINLLHIVSELLWRHWLKWFYSHSRFKCWASWTTEEKWLVLGGFWTYRTGVKRLGACMVSSARRGCVTTWHCFVIFISFRYRKKLWSCLILYNKKQGNGNSVPQVWAA